MHLDEGHAAVVIDRDVQVVVAESSLAIFGAA
jgi:hypothetical protein